jgi:release factor glutamine methyltransferase
VTLVHQDLRQGLPPGPFDLVVSNPPYVLADEIDSLEPEVRDWEAHAAHAKETGEMLASLGYEVRIVPDLAGRDRVVVGKKRS